MAGSVSIHIRAYLQYTLLLCAVIALGHYMRAKNSSQDTSTQSEVVLPSQLVVTGTPANTYPAKKLGSEKAWQKYLSSDEATSLPHYNAEGNISTYDVTMQFTVAPDGTIIGRYHNANGTNLDVNGYVESPSGKLYLRLGHGSELSTCQFSFVESISTSSSYVYQGTWGRKKKPARLIITPTSN